MRVHAKLGFWIKAIEASVLVIAVCFSIGATDPNARLHNLDHNLMCTCGCAQLLGECDHAGCTERGQELSELQTEIGAGMTDQQIFSAFTAKYGATVLAAPTTHGFDLVAWIAPFAVFAAALLGTILLIRRWSGLSGGRPAPVEVSSNDSMERERRARIRRETDMDADARGGFSHD